MDKNELEKLVEYLDTIPINSKPENELGQYESVVLICVDAVLSINRKYYSFVVPRVKYFQDNYPDINSLKKLIDVIKDNGYKKFCSYWNYNHESRVEILYNLAVKFLDIVTEYKSSTERESLREWSESVKVSDYKNFGISGIGIATYQYLRMLMGASTVKPDVHIKKSVSEAIGRKVNDIETVLLFEEACKKIEKKTSVVDHNLWLINSDKDNSNIIWTGGKWVKN